MNSQSSAARPRVVMSAISMPPDVCATIGDVLFRAAFVSPYFVPFCWGRCSVLTLHLFSVLWGLFLPRTMTCIVCVIHRDVYLCPTPSISRVSSSYERVKVGIMICYHRWGYGFGSVGHWLLPFGIQPVRSRNIFGFSLLEDSCCIRLQAAS
jgi:hypothetical protein